MSFFEDLDPLFFFAVFRGKLGVVSEGVWASMASSASCATEEAAEECRDDVAAMRLKMVAIGLILVAGVAGVALPLVGRKRRLLRTDGGMFVFAKAFAAGVILATGFVHMLHDAQEALTNPCLPDVPWRRFPFSGFVAMLAALGTLVVDFLGTQFYERKHREEAMAIKAAAAAATSAAAGATTVPMLGEEVEEEDEKGIVVIEVAPATGQEEAECGDKSPMHIVGMHAHAAAHRHSHSHGEGACDGLGRQGQSHAHAHAHAHAHGSDPDLSSHVRHVVVSQILELGIVSHSVIIGLSLGVSRSPCTIRPLVAALSFHQFFEGFALGGCVSQAQFKNLAATLMAAFFAITTPAGIAVGTGIASFYNPNSSRALVVEGLLDSVSAGILIYMALVDLIAADFLSRKMSCNVRLQVASYFALFLGAASMSSLAMWA